MIILGDLNAKTPTVGCRSLDANGRVLEDVLDSDLDLCVLNDPSQPTYFKFNRGTSNLNYSELLDLFLCSKSLANKLFSIEVLANSRMDSDHAPVVCTFGFNRSFRIDLNEPEPRFNFKKADWVSFGNTLDTMIGELSDVDRGDINSLDRIFTNLVNSSADGSIPKFTNTPLRSYPGYIVSLINSRRDIRKIKKK